VNQLAVILAVISPRAATATTGVRHGSCLAAELQVVGVTDVPLRALPRTTIMNAGWR
jgi:hypothetical protein